MMDARTTRPHPAPLPRVRLEEAADWWARMQDEEGAQRDVARWLDWMEAHPENRDAFERIQELGLRLNATRRPKTARLRTLAAAAGIALALVGALTWWKGGGPVDTQSTLHLATRVAATEQAPLPDGSKVSLGGATTVEASYTAASREVRLREGEAYFEVRPDRRVRPFVVNAGPVSIRALGTAFNVRKAQSRVAVTVTQGRVQVEGSAGTGASVEVAAGEQAIYDPSANRFRVTPVDANRSLSWRERRLEFVDEPLDAVIAHVNRYSSKRIEVRGVDLHAYSYTGTFRAETLDEWLIAISRAFPVRVEQRGDRIFFEANR